MVHSQPEIAEFVTHFGVLLLFLNELDQRIIQFFWMKIVRVPITNTVSIHWMFKIDQFQIQQCVPNVPKFHRLLWAYNIMIVLMRNFVRVPLWRVCRVFMAFNFKLIIIFTLWNTWNDLRISFIVHFDVSIRMLDKNICLPFEFVYGYTFMTETLCIWRLNCRLQIEILLALLLLNSIMVDVLIDPQSSWFHPELELS